MPELADTSSYMISFACIRSLSLLTFRVFIRGGLGFLVDDWGLNLAEEHCRRLESDISFKEKNIILPEFTVARTRSGRSS
jgi:hypothetical protein